MLRNLDALQPIADSSSYRIRLATLCYLDILSPGRSRHQGIIKLLVFLFMDFKALLFLLLQGRLYRGTKMHFRRKMIPS